MPRRIQRTGGVPDDTRLPAELLRFRDERAARQADLARYLKRLRKNVPGMTVRLAESYLIAAGVPLSASHISRMENERQMATWEKIDLPVVWALIFIYNGSLEEVNRILFGIRRERSDLYRVTQTRHEKEAGMIAAYRLLPEPSQEAVVTVTRALSQQSAAELLLTPVTPGVPVPLDEDYPEEEGDALIDRRLHQAQDALTESLRQQHQQTHAPDQHQRRGTDG